MTFYEYMDFQQHAYIQLVNDTFLIQSNCKLEDVKNLYECLVMKHGKSSLSTTPHPQGDARCQQVLGFRFHCRGELS